MTANHLARLYNRSAHAGAPGRVLDVLWRLYVWARVGLEAE